MEKKHIEKVINIAIRKFSVESVSAVIGAVLSVTSYDPVVANEFVRAKSGTLSLFSRARASRKLKRPLYKELPS